MNWTITRLLGKIPTRDRARGKTYFSFGYVEKCGCSQQEGMLTVKGVVKGTQRYTCSVTISGEEAAFHCNCPRFEQIHACKHLAALILQANESLELKARLKHLSVSSREPQIPAKQQAPVERHLCSNFLAQRLLNSLCQDVPSETEHVDAHSIVLSPVFQTCQREGYPLIRFRIGTRRMYIVKEIDTLTNAIVHESPYSFGTSQRITLRRSLFTETSLPWVDALIQCYRDGVAIYDYEAGDYYMASHYGSDRHRWACLTGSCFDTLFDRFPNGVFDCDTFGAAAKALVLYGEKNPNINLVLRSNLDGATLSFRQKSRELKFFGNDHRLYYHDAYGIGRCSEAFMRAYLPFKSLHYTDADFSKEDLPTLCEVLNTLPDGAMAVSDPNDILGKFTPENCTCAYRLDLTDSETLRAEVLFRYESGDVKFGQAPAETPEILRNSIHERRLLTPLREMFAYIPDSNEFQLSGSEQILDFLCDGIGRLQETGEVWLSDALRQKEFNRTQAPSVSLGLSDGLLSLDIDCGGFPPEELESLYDSLLKRKRYHLMRDGRYLPIRDEGYEKLAEVIHMTRLSGSDLAKGHIELPPYRALYLNSVLESAAGVSVSRDTDFRHLIRSFKSPEDGDAPLPPTLQNVLRPYQKTGFQWLKSMEEHGFGGILADDMGLGKTLQVLTFLMTARRQDQGCPSLIVCPASLVINWADEAARFTPELKTLPILGSAAERRQQLGEENDADIVITSYDLLKRDRELYANKQFYCCILDEGQTIKNQTTLVSQAVKRIDCRHRFVLTGTPIENRLSELWNLFDFLMPGYLFSHGTFTEKLEKPIAQSDSANARRQLSLLVQPFMMRRLKQDVLKDLPEKITHDRRIALSEEERRVYFAEAHAARRLAEQNGNGIQILALLTRLRQICCAPELCFEHYKGPDSKLEACMELCTSLTANGHRILLFSQFTGMLERIRARMTAAGINSYSLTGSTSKLERARLVRDFNAGGAPVFLISLKAGGTGLNLTAADIVIHYDPWWNMAAQNQATDRAHRIGQTHTVEVYRLIAKDTIEEKILLLQEKKARLMEVLNGDPTAAPLTRSEILALLNED